MKRVAIVAAAALLACAGVKTWSVQLGFVVAGVAILAAAVVSGGSYSKSRRLVVTEDGLEYSDGTSGEVGRTAGSRGEPNHSPAAPRGPGPPLPDRASEGALMALIGNAVDARPPKKPDAAPGPEQQAREELTRFIDAVKSLASTSSAYPDDATKVSAGFMESGGAGFYLRVALAFEKKGMAEESVRAMELATRLAPNCPVFRLVRCFWYRARGQQHLASEDREFLNRYLAGG